MDIIKIKKIADEETLMHEKSFQIKKDTLEILNEMQKLEMEIISKWNERIKIRSVEFFNEFKNYFTENDFSVTEDDYKIEATYKNVLFQLYPKNYEGENMTLQINEEYSFDLNIQPSTIQPYYNNIIVDGFRFIDYSHDPKYFINQFFALDQLNEVKEKIQTNLSYLKNALKNFDKTDLIIHKFNDKHQYKSFAELFESVNI